MHDAIKVECTSALMVQAAAVLYDCREVHGPGTDQDGWGVHRFRRVGFGTSVAPPPPGHRMVFAPACMFYAAPFPAPAPYSIF